MKWAEPPPVPIIDPTDEYADVVSIPFFPDDLPRLELDPFLWTPAELKSAVDHAREKLFAPPKDATECM